MVRTGTGGPFTRPGATSAARSNPGRLGEDAPIDLQGRHRGRGGASGIAVVGFDITTPDLTGGPAIATLTKNARTLQAGATNAAAGTTTGPSIDLTTRFGGLATLRITNGATGPTVACDAILETSRDNSNWFEYSRQTAGMTASTPYTFNVEVPAGVMYLRSKFTGNTGQGVAVEAHFQEIGAIA